MSVLKQAKAVALMVLLAVLSGCGGINTGYGVSPASFLVPGLNSHAPTPTPTLSVSAPTSVR